MRGIFAGRADDLLEFLKIKERPRRGDYQEEELTEDLNEKNSLGVPVSRVTVVEGEVSEQGGRSTGGAGRARFAQCY